MSYYQYKDAKVNICHTIEKMGWKIYGYKPDESDSMTDYFDPASWEGVAEKNGVALVIDNNSNGRSEEKVFEYVDSVTVNHEKINKLSNMTVGKGCTKDEEQNAKDLIQKIKNKALEEESTREKTKVLKYQYPKYQSNPTRCNWHVEKDGVIIAKGNGILKYSNLYGFDIIKNEFEGSQNWWGGEKKTLSEEQQKVVNSFKKFIDKIDGFAKIKTHDGTEDTKNIKEDEYEKTTVDKKRKIMKVFAIAQPATAEELKNYMQNNTLYFKMNVDFNYNRYKGLIYKNKEITTDHIDANKLDKKLKKALTGRANRNNFWYTDIKGLFKWIEKGSISVVQIREVEEIEKVDKWVKKENKTQAKKTTNTTKKEVDENTKEDVKNNVEVTENKELNGIEISFGEKPSPEVTTELKENGFRWHKIKKMWYAKKTLERLAFAERLKGTITPNNIKNVQQQAEKTSNENITKKESVKLIEKIKKQIEAKQEQIKKLSGEYLTNTYKRMRQQTSRNEKKESLQFDIDLLEYVKGKALDGTITKLEMGLITNANKEELHRHYVKKHGRYPQDITFPEVNKNYEVNNWYNVEVPKMQKRLNALGITDTKTLLTTIEEYKIIVDYIDKPVDQTQQKIKQLENQYKLQQKGDIHFTSKKVVDKLINYANITDEDKILEPSAGIGNIADVIKEYNSNIDVIERNYSFQELLRLKGFNVVNSDFLEFNVYDYYNKIIMNPPFSKNQDIQHLKHAYKLVKDDGIVVCITSPHWTFASDKESVDFREWIEDKTHEIYNLEAGAFEFTNVNSKIVVINKE